jgi:hypothetical protein
MIALTMAIGASLQNAIRNVLRLTIIIGHDRFRKTGDELRTFGEYFLSFPICSLSRFLS